MIRQSIIVPVLAFACFVLLMFVCGYASQKLEARKQAQCFQFNDDQRRYACLRRV